MRALKHIVLWLLVLILLGGTVWYFLSYNSALTADVLSKWGDSAAADGNTSTAITLYRWASTLQKQDQRISIALANTYKAEGNYTKAEYTLASAIAAGGDSEVYLELCRTYVEQDKLLDAVEMLDHIADPVIGKELESRRPAAPVADVAPGFYTQYMTVNLSGQGGTLYVSFGQEYPSVHTDNVSSITLPQGETTITAVCVGDNGLVSPAAVFGYTVGGVVENIQLEDPALDAYVRELLCRSAHSQLTTADLWSITEMTISAEVTDLSQMSCFTGLTSLTILDRTVLDISFLSSMPSLQVLDFSGSLLDPDQLSMIAALPDLRELTISGCQLSTISGLSGLTSLTSLNASANSISDLSPLIGNTGLVSLNLQHNAVSSFSALANLSQLSWLDLSNNSLSDFTPVSTCAGLTWLDVSSNALPTLNGISNLTALQQLNASYNALTDITGIGSCTDLVEADLSNNKLESMEEMSALTKLSTLDVSYNDIKTIPDFPDDSCLVSFNGCHNYFEDVSGLADLLSLNYVYLDYNNISDINVLSGCINLIQVNVFRTNVSDVSDLQKMDVIISYNPT